MMSKYSFPSCREAQGSQYIIFVIKMQIFWEVNIKHRLLWLPLNSELKSYPFLSEHVTSFRPWNTRQLYTWNFSALQTWTNCSFTATLTRNSNAYFIIVYMYITSHMHSHISQSVTPNYHTHILLCRHWAKL